LENKVGTTREDKQMEENTVDKNGLNVNLPERPAINKNKNQSKNTR